jgi:hypothetical protein
MMRNLEIERLGLAAMASHSAPLPRHHGRYAIDRRSFGSRCRARRSSATSESYAKTEADARADLQRRCDRRADQREAGWH